MACQLTGLVGSCTGRMLHSSTSRFMTDPLVFVECWLKQETLQLQELLLLTQQLGKKHELPKNDKEIRNIRNTHLEMKLLHFNL